MRFQKPTQEESDRYGMVDGVRPPAAVYGLMRQLPNDGPVVMFRNDYDWVVLLVTGCSLVRITCDDSRSYVRGKEAQAVAMSFPLRDVTLSMGAESGGPDMFDVVGSLSFKLHLAGETLNVPVDEEGSEAHDEVRNLISVLLSAK